MADVTNRAEANKRDAFIWEHAPKMLPPIILANRLIEATANTGMVPGVNSSINAERMGYLNFDEAAEMAVDLAEILFFAITGNEKQNHRLDIEAGIRNCSQVEVLEVIHPET